jgi:hypothetical protein
MTGGLSGCAAIDARCAWNNHGSQITFLGIVASATR